MFRVCVVGYVAVGGNRWKYPRRATMRQPAKRRTAITHFDQPANAADAIQDRAACRRSSETTLSAVDLGSAALPTQHHAAVSHVTLLR
jgi:hypothetical protein